MGEQVYYTGVREILKSGDRLEYGKQGEVVGASIGDKVGNGVVLRFSGNKGPIDCNLTKVRRQRSHRAPTPPPDQVAFERAQVSRDAPPPLPGDYKVGEQVYYVGASQISYEAHKDGRRYNHGMQGEVVGPALAGKGVTVLFPGDKRGIRCEITEVRCHHALYVNPKCTCFLMAYR